MDQNGFCRRIFASQSSRRTLGYLRPTVKSSTNSSPSASTNSRKPSFFMMAESTRAYPPDPFCNAVLTLLTVPRLTFNVLQIARWSEPLYRSRAIDKRLASIVRSVGERKSSSNVRTCSRVFTIAMLSRNTSNIRSCISFRKGNLDTCVIEFLLYVPCYHVSKHSNINTVRYESSIKFELG